MRNNFELTENEKLARQISGLEGADYFAMGNDYDLDKMIDNHHREKWNDSIQEIEDKFNGHEERLQQVADEYAKKLDKVQIMPIGNYVIVKPYNENPFQKVEVSKSGLIVSTGGLIPEYKNSDSGEMEEAEQYIITGLLNLLLHLVLLLNVMFSLLTLLVFLLLFLLTSTQKELESFLMKKLLLRFLKRWISVFLPSSNLCISKR